MTGEQGGLWRARGRAPNFTFGIGSAACGLGAGVGFKRSEASFDSAVSWIFESTEKDELIGAFGGGASGDEIDRMMLRWAHQKMLLCSQPARHTQIFLGHSMRRSCSRCWIRRDRLVPRFAATW